MENLRLRRLGGLSGATHTHTHTLHPCFAPTRPDTSQKRECGAFGALSGKWRFSEAGTEDGSEEESGARTQVWTLKTRFLEGA